MLMLLALALILSFLGNILAEKDSTQCQSVSVSYGPDVAHGTFKSPGFPLHYCNNLKSDYEIEPKSEHGVSLSIEFFDTEPLHDFVEIHQMFIYNGTMSFAKQHVLSGPMGHQPRHFMSGMGGGLKIFFTTDTTENSYSGFQMSFTRFNKEHSHHVPCPFPFYEAGNTLQTLPTLKKTYYHDTSCVIRINSTDAVKLKIRKLSTVVTLKLIETENFKSNRVHDVLENLNGFTTDKLPYEVSSRTESLLLLFTFSGVINDEPAYEIDYEHACVHAVNPELNLSDVAKGISTFTFDYKQIDLKFVSDHSVVERGFNLSLKAYKKPYYCQCPDSPKILASESYEQNHTFAEQCKYMDCIWKIYPPSLENIFRIVMKVNYRLHAESEFIEISNGENLERNNQKLRLESDAIPDDGDI
uniref:CUB domain-containing protein n=1 Tax=Panagrolaimus sp. ES5 TaxID=591445 RepID=A0AC34FCJ2_9BILA